MHIPQMKTTMMISVKEKKIMMMILVNVVVRNAIRLLKKKINPLKQK
jgi:hypothetical protein